MYLPHTHHHVCMSVVTVVCVCVRVQAPVFMWLCVYSRRRPLGPSLLHSTAFVANMAALLPTGAYPVPHYCAW
jgi:hypothetical protein